LACETPKSLALKIGRRNRIGQAKNLAGSILIIQEKFALYARRPGGQDARKNRTTKFDLLAGGEAAMRRRLLETFYSPGKK
jgi:hypothetical protein